GCHRHLASSSVWAESWHSDEPAGLLAAGGLLAGLAVLLAGRRDLGSALIGGGAGEARASSWLRSPVGLATALHRASVLAWLAGAVILAGTMGSLAQQFINLVLGNPAMA